MECYSFLLECISHDSEPVCLTPGGYNKLQILRRLTFHEYSTFHLRKMIFHETKTAAEEMNIFQYPQIL